MLYSASDYAIKSIGYLDSKDLIWDEHYKPKPLFEENLSPMRYIFSQKPLKYGYFLLLFTFVIYMVFESKRRQRIIPTNYPPNNKTREFVETVGQLYLNRKDHIDLAKKKIQYFYDFINGTFYLQVDEGSQKFRKLFAEKAMISYEESENLFNEIIRIKNSDILKDADLVKFVKMLDRIQKIKN